MIQKVFSDKPVFFLALFVVLLFSLMLVMEIVNGRFQMNDFRVMYMAADALVNQEPVYGVPFGLDTGFYKYSPFTLLLFVPYTLFSFKVASILHFTLIVICAFLALVLMERIINNYFFTNVRHRFLALFLVLLSVLLHIVKDLHLGNTNTILIFILIFSVYNTLKGNDLLAGVLLALAIITKPYFGIIVLPLLLFGKYRTLVISFVSGIVFLFITALLLGFSNSVLMHFDWLSAMLDHSDYLVSCYTIFYLLEYYTGLSISAQYSYHLFVAIGLLSYLSFWWLKRRDAKEGDLYKTNQAFLVYYFFIIAVVPNILITDNEHFIFTLPLIALVIFYLSSTRSFGWMILFGVFILMYGGNSTDLVGKELTLLIKHMGILGIGNLLIITFALSLFYFKRKGWKLDR